MQHVFTQSKTQRKTHSIRHLITATASAFALLSGAFSSHAAALTTGNGATVPANAQQVKIGVAGPLTGPEAHYGRDFQNGIILAAKHFNASHPIVAGHPIQIDLVIADDQANPRVAKIVAQKLIDDGIKGMLGHFNSGTTLPASRDYAQAGIPQISMATAAKYTMQGFKTTFRMMTSDAQQGQVAGKYAAKTLGFKRMVVIDDRTAYGQGLADEFAKAAKAAGATIIAHEFTSDQATDFKAILTKFKTSQPDAIFYSGADRQAASMAIQMRALGLKAHFIAGDMAKTPAFLKIAGRAAEGTIVSLAGLPLENMPGGKAFIDQYKAAFHEDVQVYAPYAYDGAMALFHAMQNANSTEPARYLPFLAKIERPGVTTKEFAYDQHGNLKDARITLYKVINGQWQTLSSATSEEL